MKLSTYKVLIVDDNPTFVKTLGILIKSVLGEKLILLDEAYNGQQAVEKVFNKNKYNVIFMDVNMPEMDGITATKLLNRELYRETRIVAVSFNKDFNILNKMIEAGACNYLLKDNLTIESLEHVFEVTIL